MQYTLVLYILAGLVAHNEAERVCLIIVIAGGKHGNDSVAVNDEIAKRINMRTKGTLTLDFACMEIE